MTDTGAHRSAARSNQHDVAWISLMHLGRRTSRPPRSVRLRTEIGSKRPVGGGAVVGCGSCAGVGRSSPVLHMGGRGLRGARVGFWRDHAFSRRLTCSVAGLPCALRGDCAHGSRVLAAAETAFPHDSWVFANTNRARMCNIHRPGTHGARQSRSAAVRHGSRVHLGGRERPLTSLGRNRTDLGAELDRSRRRGVRDRAGARAACPGRPGSVSVNRFIGTRRKET